MVAGESFITSAVSSILSPPKNRQLHKLPLSRVEHGETLKRLVQIRSIDARRRRDHRRDVE